MKPSIIAGVLIVSAMLAAKSFTAEKLQFKARMQGVEDRDLSAGITPAQFSVLTIETENENVKVTRFDIILARQKSPVERATPTGNSLDLAPFKKLARPGDRFVIEVKNISGQEEAVTGKERIITIPIK